MITVDNQPRIGVYICHCGTNIAATVDVQELSEFASTLPGVVVARTYKYMCSDPGQELIKKDIAEHRLNRIVVSACSPLLHEKTFRSRRRGCRTQSVPGPDGQHPRARGLGHRGQAVCHGARPRPSWLPPCVASLMHESLCREVRIDHTARA